MNSPFSVDVVSRYWLRIIFTLAAISQFHTVGGLLDRSRSATFELAYLKCLHKFVTQTYKGQDLRNIGSISMLVSACIFRGNIRNLITTLASTPARFWQIVLAAHSINGICCAVHLSWKFF